MTPSEGHEPRRGRARPRRRRIAAAVALSVALALAQSACIRAPDVVLVDRRTALEAEAAGRFDQLEERLDQRAIDPRPLPLTRARLEAAGWRPRAEDDAIAEMTRTAPDEQGRVDDLLRRGCIGEGLDGLLAATPQRCTGARDPAEIGRLLERNNRARRQIWAWMRRKGAGASDDAIRAAWRANHLPLVVCDGLVEVVPRSWQPKACP
jgi:hypothetical protein